jgi:tetratricopeptide (TPR) repeat protein
MIKSGLAILGAVVCALAIWESARIGYARTYALQALKTNDLSRSDRSAQVLPNDAEVHAARGVVLQRIANYPEACSELERAAQLRPRDYFLWMMLGVTRDLNDDSAGGTAALRQAVALAPLYARPRWFLGNLLLRQGDVEAAFQELRFAAERDATLLPNVIDLAWGIAKGNPQQTVALIKPDHDRARMALAIFLAARKQPEVALEQFRSVAKPSVEDANQFTERLIESRFFADAHEIWRKSHCSGCVTGSFINASFEDEIDLRNRGFGWQIPANVSGVTLSIDGGEHASGARSLRIDFQGNATPQATLASQLLVVDPGKRYQISLQMMTKSFVSPAGPVVKIIDASDERLPPLGQLSLKSDASGWQTYTIQFTAGANTRAVQMSLSRDNCATDPCAAFGTLWLDSFAINKE